MTRNLVNRIVSGSLSRLVQDSAAKTGRRAQHRRRSRSTHDLNSWDALEGRIVLTAAAATGAWAWGGGSLLGTLTGVGVVTGPVVPNPRPVFPIPVPIHFPRPIWNGGMTTGSGNSGTNPFSQLQTDWKALITELQSLAAKSGVTVANIESLALDNQSITQAGFYFDRSSLHSVISELATAVAGGTSTTQAQSDWTALFNGSSVSTTVVNDTFNDLVTTIQNSSVTTTDLSTVASDEAAIQADLSKFWVPFMSAASGSAMGPSPLLATSSLPAMSVTLATPSSAEGSAIQAIDNVLPVVTQSFIVSPGMPFIVPFIPCGVNLLGSLTHVGVVTGPVQLPPVMPMPLPMPIAWSMPMIPVGQNPNFQQLQTDIKALQSELQSLASKSGLTVAELQNLAQDSQTISQAGVHIMPSALNTVISELATAVAGNASTAQAQSDWTALFAGSTVSTTAITGTFNDLVNAIKSSNVTTTDLTTVANDEAAIQNDLKNLFSGNSGNTGSNSGSGSNSGPGSNSGTTTGGLTGSKHSKPTPVVNRLVKHSGRTVKRLDLSLHTRAKAAKAHHKKA
jgi:hypothetical protein